MSLICLAAVAFEVYTLGFDRTTRVEANGLHQVLLGEFRAGAPVSQTFRMHSDGFQGVRVRVAASEPADLVFDWALFEERDAETIPLFRDRGYLIVATGETWADIAFPTIPDSTTRFYRLELRARTLSPPGAVALMMSLDDQLPEGRLQIDGVEQWGDLVFDTVARGDTMFGRFRMNTLEGAPGPLASARVTVGLLAAYNALLAAFVFHFWPAARPPLPADERAAARSPSSARGLRRLAYAMVTLAVGWMTVMAYRWVAGPSAVSLIDEFHHAELRTLMKVHTAFVLTEELDGGRMKRIVAAHPDSEIRWPVRVLKGMTLRTAIGIATPPGTISSDGVVFRIGAEDDGGYSELMVFHLDPARFAQHRGWVPVAVDLQRYAGRRVRLILKTEASPAGRPPDFTYDWARWEEPVLVRD